MVLKINSFVVKSQGRAYLYDVLIEVQGKERKATLNKSRIGIIDKVNFQKIVACVHQRTKKFGVAAEFAYDGVSILYSNKQFEDMEHILVPADLPQDLKKFYNHDLIVTLTKTSSQHVLDLGKKVESMSIDEVSEYKRLISLVCCQDAINRGVYFVADSSVLYKANEASTPLKRHEVEFRLGFGKGVRLAKAANGLYPVIDIDAKVGAFYKSQLVSDTWMDLGNNHMATTMFLNNVTVYPEYNPHRRLRFGSVMKETPRQQIIEDKKMSIQEYFLKEKKINLKPNLPLVRVKPAQAGMFPAEVCVINPYQKIQNEHMEPSILEALHKENAVKANERYANIGRIIADLKFDNPIVKAFGMTISNKMQELQNPQIFKPSVQFKDSVSTPKPNGNFDDKSFKFVYPGKVDNWSVFYSSNSNRDVIKGFVADKLMPKARDLGLSIAPPKDLVSVDFRDIQALYAAFEKVKNNGCKFALFIEPKYKSVSHEYIKMMEAVLGVVTQQLDYKNVQGCGNVTLGNIVNKINLKNGGANYAPKTDRQGEGLALDKGTFVIGLHARHSKTAPQRVGTTDVLVREPSVIGICANCAKNANSFVGNFKYQRDPRSENDSEMIDPAILSEQVFNMFMLLKKNRPQKPSKIVVLRDGISSYNYEALCRAEVKAIKTAVAKFDPKWEPKVIYLVTTKEHGVRVFNEDRGQINNPVPGTIVADEVVERGSEFLICAQNAFKGTAKCVIVNVVLNESDVKIAGIMKFIHGLCYNHQLTLSSVALPEPVYQAGILSERGHSVLKTFKEVFPNRVPRDGAQYNIAKINEDLSINDKEMESVRFTA